MNNTTAAWEWRDGREAVTATWKVGGWPVDRTEPDGRKQPCRSTLARRAAGLPPCKNLAEWQVERRQGNRISTGWFCMRDLPSTEAPPIDAERTEP
ncbi:hypothetical protein ACKI1S_42610 [Streptomyces galilaeus]|uniref:Uncharacterized protein n=1 Tax=Streptomyces galilaeus TaxID=33899 RepID=A0ABW9IXS2_STRGJ